MLDLAGATIALFGRPDRASRKVIATELARIGGRLSSAISGRCAVVVLCHGAVSLQRNGRLETIIETADERRVPVIGEQQMLRALKLLPGPTNQSRPFSADELAGRSGLPIAAVRMLAVFDLLDEADGRFGFRDIVVARMIAELIGQGANIADILDAGLRLRRASGYRDDLSKHRLTLAADGSVLVMQDGQPVEPGGQIRLALDTHGAAAFEEIADAAEQAEDDGDLDGAERLYRQALQIRRHDVVCLANLANILMARNEGNEASTLLLRAVAADPSYADAWYNLACIAQQRGDRQSMQRRLERAIKARPDYADAIYNLAHLHFTAEEYEAAEPLWRRYLALDQTSTWAQTARRALKVCEMARMNMSA